MPETYCKFVLGGNRTNYMLVDKIHGESTPGLFPLSGQGYQQMVGRVVVWKFHSRSSNQGWPFEQ
jgi:hypothetical protein